SDPSTIATGGSMSEMYQGVPVELNGVSVIKEANTYGEWTVTGNLLVDDIFYSYKPSLGTRFSRLVGILHTTFNNYKLEPRDEKDIEVEITDGGVDVLPDIIEDTGVMVRQVTIYDIQNTASGNHPAENEPIIVKNVVVTAPTHSASANLNGIFVQEKNGGEYSGILVVYPKNLGLGPFTIGDEVTIEGSYKEYNDLSEIVATNIIKIGTTTIPSPEVVNPNDIATGGAKAENYEGVLVKVENVEVINANPDAPNDYKEFTITGNLRVNDLYLYDYTNKRRVGDKFNYIIGVLNYTYGNFKLEPRGNADLSLVVVGPDAGEDVSEDVVSDAVVSDAGQDVVADVSEDTGTQVNCDNIVKHIVISEVATRGQTAYDEFVELYNPLNGDVDLSGWKLQYKSSTGTTWGDRLVFGNGTVIKAHGYLLLAADTADYSGPTPDLKFSATGMADNAHIRIIDKNGAEVDKIGFSSTDPEGSPATIPCTSSPCTKSVERKARATSTPQTMSAGGVDELAGNGYDTNNNANDFIVRQTRNPQNSQSAKENHGCFDCQVTGEEVCDGKDNDCNGLTDAEDPGLRLDCELRLGVCAGAKHTASQCVGGAWTRACNATEYGPNYSASELCDDLDNNCDGNTDESFTNKGQSCSAGIGECKRNGVFVCKSDKSGTECNVTPGQPATEVCDNKDNNCDGQTDEENAQGCIVYYRDLDSDTYGVSGDKKCLCSSVIPYTATRGGDCNDSDRFINPGATEVCDGKDNDCDGNTDDGEMRQGCKEYYYDADGDIYYAFGAMVKCLCVPNPIAKFTGIISGDCDDSNNNVYPGKSEVTDGLDNDCDGRTSEGQYHATWGNIQWADKGTPVMTISSAEDTGNIYGRVYAAGITDLNRDPGLIEVQIGILPENDASKTKWIKTTMHNSLCSGCGNN
ncbi:MAG: MopE-related protein, partial [Deltaproteobacteria bacterium]|nr:MopE-related protein [Deltaproteobacteria bacterium]